MCDNERIKIQFPKQQCTLHERSFSVWKSAFLILHEESEPDFSTKEQPASATFSSSHITMGMEWMNWEYLKICNDKAGKCN